MIKNLDCEYSGVVHQSGETWSPGPCVPKCHCDNGHIKCSKLECPDLNCEKPVKRRWKCCPECLPNSDNGTFLQLLLARRDLILMFFVYSCVSVCSNTRMYICLHHLTLPNTASFLWVWLYSVITLNQL